MTRVHTAALAAQETHECRIGAPASITPLLLCIRPITTSQHRPRSARPHNASNTSSAARHHSHTAANPSPSLPWHALPRMALLAKWFLRPQPPAAAIKAEAGGPISGCRDTHAGLPKALLVGRPHWLDVCSQRRP
jgi:hypothetical protein